MVSNGWQYGPVVVRVDIVDRPGVLPSVRTVFEAGRGGHWKGLSGCLSFGCVVENVRSFAYLGSLVGGPIEEVVMWCCEGVVKWGDEGVVVGVGVAFGRMENRGEGLAVLVA